MKKFAKIAFLFPGQGAQYPGMAKDFVEEFSVARETLEEADDVLGRKLSLLILHGPENELTETKNSQVGIFVASIAILRAIKTLFPNLETQVSAGLSLGEYTALVASERLSFNEALSLVQHRGHYMNDACEATKGTMAVIMGLDSEAVESLVKEANAPNDLWAANFNCPGQVVISGTMRGIELGSELAKAKGAKRVVNLQVHGAFHSGLMREAEERLAEHIYQAPLKESKIELIMNVPGSAVKEVSLIRENLIKQVTHPVRWEHGIRFMVNHGVDLFLEIGCGKTLTGFNKRIGVLAPALNVEKISDVQALEKMLGESQ